MLPVQKIQKWLKKNNTDIFLINRTDQFLSEYIAPFFERLQWISNFSGSAGRAIIEKNKAYIFVDGRYTNQVREEVDTSYFEIIHLKEYWNFIEDYKNKNIIISIDAFLHSVSEVNKIKNIFKNNKATLSYVKSNPIDLFWKDQPKKPNFKAFIHEIKYSGKEASSKINSLQKILKINSINYYFSSSLDSIAWLLNIRGNDIENTPLVCCYIIIPSDGKVELFIDKEKINNCFQYLENIAKINKFEEIDKYIHSINSKISFGMDENSTPYFFKQLCLEKNINTVDFEDPCLYPKAQKNKIELEGARKANLRDGVSITKFLYWIKNHKQVEEIDEINAAEYLLNLRVKNKLYFSLSFETISAFGYHAALPHYRVSKKTNLSFKNNSIYLVDSGAQYKDGTTDITRTIVIGNPSNEQKDRFTRVLKGHIGIAQSIFKSKILGSELDPLARKALKEIGWDYDHGTGHGIGSFLSVHEGPQRIAKSQGQSDGYISEGMIISNEPGYYKENEYGIRIENLLICNLVDHSNLTNLITLNFETISWAPIDKDLIELKLLNKKEINWLNNYHSKVFNLIGPKLNTKERIWLKKATSPL